MTQEIFSEMSDREILVLLHERMSNLCKQYNKLEEKTEKIEEDKVSKKSVSFLATILGSVTGLIIGIFKLIEMLK